MYNYVVQGISLKTEKLDILKHIYVQHYKNESNKINVRYTCKL